MKNKKYYTGSIGLMLVYIWHTCLQQYWPLYVFLLWVQLNKEHEHCNYNWWIRLPLHSKHFHKINVQIWYIITEIIIKLIVNKIYGVQFCFPTLKPANTNVTMIRSMEHLVLTSFTRYDRRSKHKKYKYMWQINNTLNGRG